MQTRLSRITRYVRLGRLIPEKSKPLVNGKRSATTGEDPRSGTVLKTRGRSSRFIPGVLSQRESLNADRSAGFGPYRDLRTGVSCLPDPSKTIARRCVEKTLADLGRASGSKTRGLSPGIS